MEKTSFLKEPVGGQSVVNKIVDNITNAIINGELNPGDKIPTEAELSESMGAGRNSVREAIKVLEAYGVVHIKRAEGTFVSQEYDSRMIYPVLYGIILQKDSTSQIVELRKVIDVGLLQLAVDKLRSKSLEQTQMEAIEKAMEELEYQAHMDKPQARSLYEADVQFHMAIVGITENVMLQSICNYVDKITRRSRMVTIDRIFLDGEVENFLDLHRRIVKLLQDSCLLYTSDAADE